MASETKLHIDLLESAWGIIANAGGGDWNNETAEWQQAARRFRAEYHVMLAEHRTPPPADAGREAVNWKAVRSAALTFAQDGDCTALDRALTRAGAPCPHFRPTEFGGDTCYFCGRDVRRHASPDNARAALAREGQDDAV